MGENIHLEKNVADGIAVIRLDRPKVNALNGEMMRDLRDLRQLTVDTPRAWWLPVAEERGRRRHLRVPGFTAETAQQFSNMFNDYFSPWRTFRRSRSRPSTALRSAAASKSRLRPTFA